jgi:hypothetical protein
MSDHGPYSDLKSSPRFDMGLNDKPVPQMSYPLLR